MKTKIHNIEEFNKFKETCSSYQGQGRFTDIPSEFPCVVIFVENEYSSSDDIDFVYFSDFKEEIDQIKIEEQSKILSQDPNVWEIARQNSLKMFGRESF